MSEKIIKCAKCQNNAETKPRGDEFTHTYAIRDKDGQIYCWDCYKGFSVCKGCQKSVANLKFPRSGNPYYPHASGYSIGCERIENKVEFICSEECSKKWSDQKYQAWKDKLSQGWTKCEACVKFWIDGESNEEGWEWLKEERQHSRFIKLLPPEEKGVCERCKPYEKNGYYHQIHQKSQKHWDSLNQEVKLAEVIRTDGVEMAKFYGQILTAEQLAEQEKVPRSIYEDFVHNQKCCACGEEPCHLEKKNKNNSSCPLSSAADENNSQNDNSEKGGNNQQSQANQKQEIKSPLGGNHSGLIIGGIVIASLISLATILVVRKGKRNRR